MNSDDLSALHQPNEEPPTLPASFFHSLPAMPPDAGVLSKNASNDDDGNKQEGATLAAVAAFSPTPPANSPAAAAAMDDVACPDISSGLSANAYSKRYNFAMNEHELNVGEAASHSFDESSLQGRGDSLSRSRCALRRPFPSMASSTINTTSSSPVLPPHPPALSSNHKQIAASSAVVTSSVPNDQGNRGSRSSSLGGSESWVGEGRGTGHHHNHNRGFHHRPRGRSPHRSVGHHHRPTNIPSTQHEQSAIANREQFPYQYEQRRGEGSTPLPVNSGGKRGGGGGEVVDYSSSTTTTTTTTTRVAVTRNYGSGVESEGFQQHSQSNPTPSSAFDTLLRNLVVQQQQQQPQPQTQQYPSTPTPVSSTLNNDTLLLGVRGSSHQSPHHSGSSSAAAARPHIDDFLLLGNVTSPPPPPAPLPRNHPSRHNSSYSAAHCYYSPQDGQRAASTQPLLAASSNGGAAMESRNRRNYGGITTPPRRDSRVRVSIGGGGGGRGGRGESRERARRCSSSLISSSSSTTTTTKFYSGGGEMGAGGNGSGGYDGGGEEVRETWERKIDFLLSVVGFAVDLANVWRFPYLCFKNGGGAFLIPYTIMVFLAGIPLFYMELALGQFHRKGAITTWGRICPLFKGIGYCVIMTAFYTDFFYNVIIAFALHYFFASFTSSALPWTRCSAEYNSPACYEPSWADLNTRECASGPMFLMMNHSGRLAMHNKAGGWNSHNHNLINNNSSTWKSHQPISAAEEYFYKYFLGLHERGEPTSHVYPSIDNLGPINWEIVACVAIIYLICYFSLWKGIKMSGKVVWFTAIFPYVVLGVLLIRGVTLPGAARGIEYYLRPNLEMLRVPSVWQDAATQVFFSLGPGFGVLMAYSSYNEFHNNVYFDALLTSTINCCTSFLAGFVIFSVLGYMSCKSGKPIHDVAQEGPGLVFVVYPEALATMPGASLWSIIFFLMLLTLGLDSSFGGSEAIITGLGDEFPWIRRNRELFVALLFLFYMFVGVFMCTHGGMLIMEWLIVYGTTWGLLVAVFCETMVISFCYGIDRFSADIRRMLGFAPGWYWRVCWTVGAPLFLMAMIASSIINYQPLQYQDYTYPTGANVLGVLFALSSVSAIPLVAIYTLYNQRDGASFCERLQLALTPYYYQGTSRQRLSTNPATAMSITPTTTGIVLNSVMDEDDNVDSMVDDLQLLDSSDDIML